MVKTPCPRATGTDQEEEKHPRAYCAGLGWKPRLVSGDSPRRFSRNRTGQQPDLRCWRRQEALFGCLICGVDKRGNQVVPSLFS